MAEGIRAGALYWDLDVKQADQAKAKVREIGKELDRALNAGRGANTGLDKVGRDAGAAANRVQAFATDFAKLKVQLDTGQISATQFGTSTKKLLGDLNGLARAADVSEKELRGLATLIPQVTKANATLGGSTRDVQAKTQQLNAEMFTLRGTIQVQGRATEAQKVQLRALRDEMLQLANTLRVADGGMQKFGGSIRQLTGGARTAEATLAGVEGRMSFLGLASQVNLATQQALTSQLYRYGPAGQVAGSALGIVGSGMTSLSIGTAGVAAGLVASAAAIANLTRTGIPEVREFQQALSVLRASGEAYSESGLVEALEDTRDAAGEAGEQFSRAEMATALAELVKAGLEAKDALNLLAPAMNLAVITGDSLNDTSSRLLANLRQFGLDSTEAARAADMLATADLAAADGAKELSEGLSVVGTLASTAGFKLSDTLAILVELNNKGLNPADMGATALRTTLAGLLDPTAEAVEVLADLGVELKDADGASRPLLTVLREVQKALEGNSEAAQAAAKIFDTRAITAILNLSDKSVELADKLANSEGAAKAFAEELLRVNLAMSETAKNKAWRDLSATFALHMTPGLIAMNQGLRDLYRALDDLANAPWWERLNAQSFILRRMLGIGGGGESEEEIEIPPPTGYTTGGTMSDLKRDVDSVKPSMTELIVEATRLKLALDEAVKSSDPQKWIVANTAVDKFRATSEEAALAWQAVNAAMRGEGSAGTTTTARTIQNVMDDLALAGQAARDEAKAFGNTLEAQLDAAKTRATLVGRAITELLTDFDLDPADDRIQYLTGRLQDLRDLQDDLNDRLSRKPQGLQGMASIGTDQPFILGGTIPANFDSAEVLAADQAFVKALSDQEALRAAIEAAAETDARLRREQMEVEQIQARIRRARVEDAAELDTQLARERLLEEQAIARVQRLRHEREVAHQQAMIAAAVARASALDAALTTERAEADTLQADADAQAVVRGNQVARVTGIVDAAIASGDRLVIQEALKAIEGFRERFGEAWAKAVFEESEKILVKTVDQLEARASRAETEYVRDSLARLNLLTPATSAYTGVVDRAGGAVVRLTEAQIALGTASEADLVPALETQIAAIEALKPLVEVGSKEWFAYAKALVEARERLDELTQVSIRDLQAQLQALRAAGLEPTSEAVQELVRQINELQLRAALEELKGGASNLSDFAKSVLVANGVMQEAIVTGATLVDRLQNLGGVSGGFASFFEGIKEAAEAGDAEGKIKGITKAVDGLHEAVKAIAEGDVLSVVRNLGSGIAEMIAPGLGGLFASVFDLGTTIVQSISDAFNGDSPAARAIRDSLTPTITSAFTQGIINGIRGAEGWQDGLRDNVKLIFLQSLIEAFINGAIIQTFLQPIIDQYSKLIAKGNVEAATAYLQTHLPPALDQAVGAAEGFVGSLPPGLLPSSGEDGGTAPQQSQSSFNLPYAIPATPTSGGAAEFGRYVTSFGSHVSTFGNVIKRLQDQGVTVNVAQQPPRPGGGSAVAARAA